MTSAFTTIDSQLAGESVHVPLSASSRHDESEVQRRLITAARKAEAEARDAAALLEIVGKVVASPDLRRACYALVNHVQELLGCEQVAISLRRRGRGSCRLAAVSEKAQFDVRSERSRAIESACDEAVLRGEPTTWPPHDPAQAHSLLAHKHLCDHLGMPRATSVPLLNGDGQVIGAVLLLHANDEPDDERGRALNLLNAAGAHIGGAIDLVRRLEGSRLTRCLRAIGRLWTTWKGKLVFVAAALLLAAMWIPLPYKITCDSQIEPVRRRFVAAPFEGTLEKSLAKPGDLVREGQVLARMDGREIRWERAAAVADHEQEAKRRDSALAKKDFAEAQIARLEMQRLEVKLQLLDKRAENLEIKSPIDGIVTSGDLERAEGAPLTIGQSLFEIAPLDKMVVEIAVPDEEISHVADGQEAVIRLDAYPGETWRAKLANLQPRAEIRDHENVFVAEVPLDNSSGMLRPGMKGRAKVVTPHKTLGWILFHRPWNYLTKSLGW